MDKLLRSRTRGKVVAMAMMALILLLAVAASSSLTPPMSKPKATWLWDTSLIGTSAERTNILEFAKKQQVDRIFLQVNQDADQGTYRSFIRTASDYGIQVHALDGAPNWALPENRHKITELVQWVKAYNASVFESERFTGIQVDIEPYQLPEWTKDQKVVAENWKQSLIYFHELVKKDSALTTAAAVPFWLDAVKLPGGSATLGEAIMSVLDETVLMSYRDQAKNVVDLAAAKVAEGDRLGKKVWISVETNPAADTPHITFYAQGQRKMERQLALIDGMLKAHTSYSGIAVHDYTGWRSLDD